MGGQKKQMDVHLLVYIDELKKLSCFFADKKQQTDVLYCFTDLTEGHSLPFQWSHFQSFTRAVK